MSILTLSVAPAKVVWGYRANIKTNETVTGQRQRIDRTGQRWLATVTWPPTVNADSAALHALLMQLGQPETFVELKDYNYKRQGVGGGTPVINGAGQTGTTLALNGATASVTNWAKAGDRVQLSTHQVVEVIAAANSDASGNVSLSVLPAIRVAPTNGSTVDMDTPKAVFELLENDQQWTEEPADFSGFSVALIEQLNPV